MTLRRGLTLEPDLRARIAHREAVLGRVKTMLITSLKLDLEPEHIDPDTPLFGAGLGLDSVDAVEVVVALGRRGASRGCSSR
mgnify:CR=1 FL=1